MMTVKATKMAKKQYVYINKTSSELHVYRAILYIS